MVPIPVAPVTGSSLFSLLSSSPVLGAISHELVLLTTGGEERTRGDCGEWLTEGPGTILEWSGAHF